MFYETFNCVSLACFPLNIYVGRDLFTFTYYDREV